MELIAPKKKTVGISAKRFADRTGVRSSVKVGVIWGDIGCIYIYMYVYICIGFMGAIYIYVYIYIYGTTPPKDVPF